MSPAIYELRAYFSLFIAFLFGGGGLYVYWINDYSQLYGFIIISILSGFVAYIFLYNYRVTRSKAENLENSLNIKVKTKINIQELINDLMLKINSKRKDSLNQLINSFQKEFDVNSDKTLTLFSTIMNLKSSLILTRKKL